MTATYFDTYLRALEKCEDVQGVLGEEWVLLPPDPDYGYDATPRNALTFGIMGVDGAHYGILTIGGAVTDESPVVQICPMDFSDQYQVLGDCFLDFCATACGVSIEKMDSVFASERAGQGALVPFMKAHFDMSRLNDDSRYQKLEPHLTLIVRRA